MTTSSQHTTSDNQHPLIGTIRWISFPHPRADAPFLSLILDNVDDDSSYLALLVHDEAGLASSTDLLYLASETSMDRDVVVQTSFPFEVPISCIGHTVIGRISQQHLDEVKQMYTGYRRVARRTGVFIRSYDDTRWDLMTAQHNILQEFVGAVEDFAELGESQPDLVAELELASMIALLGTSDENIILARMVHSFEQLGADIFAVDADALSRVGLPADILKLLLNAMNTAGSALLRCDDGVMTSMPKALVAQLPQISTILKTLPGVLSAVA